jgi:hypothetical protein
MLGFVLTLAAYYMAVSIFSGGAAARSRGKIFALAFIATALLSFVANRFPTLLGFTSACLLAAGISLAGLIFFLGLTRIQAAKVTGAYIGFVIVFAVVSWSLISWLNAGVA